MRGPLQLGVSRVVLAFAVLVTSSAAATTKESARRSPAQPHFKKPFRQGLKPLPTGSLVTIGRQAHLDARAYRDISLATQTLLRRYPAHKHFFIGLGRDPAPIIAFLQNLGGKQLAINFPASSNESGMATVEVLAKYVKRLVPAGVLESGRTIVFVDATSSGRALDHYVPLIKPSLNGAKVIKAAYGVRWESGRGGIYDNPGDKKVINTSRFPEVNKFYSDPYEDVVSEYPRHGPGMHSITVLNRPRPQYGRFREALMKRMQRDRGLNAFLRQHGGPAFGE